MKSRFILLAAIAATAFTSCSVYKSGQTPDDVYFSPGAERGDAYVNVEERQDQRYSRSYEDSYYDDQYLRMRVRNRYRWSAFDDYYGLNDWRYNSMYYNSWNPYSWGGGSAFHWNNYWTWNNWYNPYCGSWVIVNPKTSPGNYSRLRNFSLGSYTNSGFNNGNLTRNGKWTSNSNGTASRPARYYLSPTNTGSRYNNTNSNSLGSSLRKVFGGNNNNGRNSYYNPSSSSSGSRPVREYSPSNSSSNSRSYTPSSSSSSNSGGGGSSSSGGSRPNRGGRQ